MKIGIIGSGNIGGTLGKHWQKAGHEVMFSSRHPEELKDMANEAGAQVGTPREAAEFGEAILLAVPFHSNSEIGQELGDLKDKILIDATNPYPGRDGKVAEDVIDNPQQTSTGYTDSKFKGVKTVKAFNSVYYKVLEERAFRQGDDRVAVQIASDDEAAKKTVKQLIEDIGMWPQDLGKLTNGTKFEPGAALYNKNLQVKEARDLFQKMG